jgi:hypothetical protein
MCFPHHGSGFASDRIHFLNERMGFPFLFSLLDHKGHGGCAENERQPSNHNFIRKTYEFYYQRFMTIRNVTGLSKKPH